MYLLVSIISIISLATICGLCVVFGFKERHYEKKIEFLSHLVDKGYESNNIDLNNL